MIRLNLLPHRDAARKKKREQFVAAVVLAALVGVGISLLAFSWYQSAIHNQRATEKLLEQMRRLSGRFLEATTIGVPKRKPRK